MRFLALDTHHKHVEGSVGADWDVFISYSSKDVTRAEALETLLEKAGLSVWRDKKRILPGDNYVFSIHDGIERAKRVVVLWSSSSIASDYVTAEVIYARGKKKLVPVYIEPCEPKVPFNIEHGLSLSIINTQPEILLRTLRGEKQPDGTYRIHSIAPGDIDTWRLPHTFSPKLFGRETERVQLFEAWNNPRSHIVVFDAIGGAGKTALVRRFIQDLEQGGWRGVQRVFVWSFYGQGTDVNRQGDADPFYIAALIFFGFEREAAEAEARKQVGRKPTQKEVEQAQLALVRRDLSSPAEKGRALARLVRERRTLLILDGIEPLQYPAGRTGGRDGDTGVSGVLKDKGMALLLRELATDNPGLVIVTTRIKLKDLQEFPKPAVLPIALTALAEAPAIELLKTRGVTGSQRHLVAIANDLRGHALALNLAAQYLVTHHSGDARRADLLPDLAQVGGDDERDPYRVMSAYEIELKKQIARQLGIIPEWAHNVKLDHLLKDDKQALSEKALSTAAGKQLALLYMLGLFDQPVPRKVFDVLIEPPAIPGLTDGIAEAHVRATQWDQAIARLREQGLISPDDADASGTLDCHPLVRDYFGQRLAQIDRTAFKAGHSRLYDHYRCAGLPAAFLPADEVGMMPVFAAIAHGCTAELEIETFNKVYWPRISRGDRDFATRELGLWGSELQAIARFFEEPFEMPSRRLNANLRRVALAQAGYLLQGLGRLRDARSPTRAALLASIEQGREVWQNCSLRQRERWVPAAVAASNFSELSLLTGQIQGEEGAIAMALKAVPIADFSTNIFQRIHRRTDLADAYHAAGSIARSEASLCRAEQLQKSAQPRLPRLYALQGWRLCDQLLSRGRGEEASARVDWALSAYQVDGKEWPRYVGIDTMVRVRAILAAVPLSTRAKKDCLAAANSALFALRRANHEGSTVQSLIAYAEALWRCGDAEAAGEPLGEAENTAASGPMPLFIAQAHLLRARISLTRGEFAAAHEKRDAAAALIKMHDYGRGAVELAVLDAELAIAENSPDADDAITSAVKAVAGQPYYDKITGRTISGGWFGLVPRLEAILPRRHAGLLELRAARDAYNAERDEFLRSTLANMRGYDPTKDPIGAYLAARGRWPRLRRWFMR